MVRRNAKLLRYRDQVRLVRLEEAQEGGQQPWLARSAAKLFCPDSGQVDEPLGASSVTYRCRERSKA